MFCDKIQFIIVACLSFWSTDGSGDSSTCRLNKRYDKIIRFVICMQRKKQFKFQKFKLFYYNINLVLYQNYFILFQKKLYFWTLESLINSLKFVNISPKFYHRHNKPIQGVCCKLAYSAKKDWTRLRLPLLFYILFNYHTIQNDKFYILALFNRKKS